MYKSKYKPMRFNTTFDLAITALIEFSSLGLYFIGTIWEHKNQERTKVILLSKEKILRKYRLFDQKINQALFTPSFIPDPDHPSIWGVGENPQILEKEQVLEYPF